MNKLLDENTLREGMNYLREIDKDLKEIVDRREINNILFRRTPGFQGLINLIVEQQLSTSSAKAIFSRIRAMISPFNAENFILLSDKQLKEAGLSGQKISYCRGIAKSVITKKLDFNSIQYLGDKEVIECLTKFKGVGEWTANCYLLACMSRVDAWPSADLGIQMALQRIKRLKEKPNKLTTEKLSEPWKPFRSIAALLLWSTYD